MKLEPRNNAITSACAQIPSRNTQPSFEFETIWWTYLIASEDDLEQIFDYWTSRLFWEYKKTSTLVTSCQISHQPIPYNQSYFVCIHIIQWTPKFSPRQKKQKHIALDVQDDDKLLLAARATTMIASKLYLKRHLTKVICRSHLSEMILNYWALIINLKRLLNCALARISTTTQN